jgi:hypothetical protein
MAISVGPKLGVPTRDVRTLGRQLNIGLVTATDDLSPFRERPELLLWRDVGHD